MIAEEKSSEELRKLEYKEEASLREPLAFFNDALWRLRKTMVEYMMGVDSYTRR